MKTLLANLRALQTAEGRQKTTKFNAFMTLVGITDGLAILLLLPIINRISQGQSPGVFLLALGLIALAGLALRYVTTLLGYSIALDFLRSAHRIIGDKLATLPLGWFRPSRTGGLSSLVSDKFMQATEMFAHQSGVLIREAWVLITLTIGAFVWNAWVGLVFLVLAPVTIAVMRASSALKEYASNQALPAGHELSSRILEFARNQPALRAAGRSEHFSPLERALEADYRARYRELWLSTAAIVLSGLIVQLFVVAIIATTSWLAAEKSMAALTALAFIGIALRFSKTLENLSQAFLGLDSGRLALDETAKITGAHSLPEPTEPKCGDDSGSVEFDHVTFSYGADAGDASVDADDTADTAASEPVLRDISFRVAPRTVTAIVGPSGSGKTTITRLVSRFFDVDSGTVRVDGVDIRDMGTEALMSKLSMVFQDVYLFDDTLYNNVAVGRPSASREEVLRAADLAGVTEIANRLGWNTRVGESGGLLSGGERQRVSIARALLKDASIVLFDEATSALDGENEANILRSMAELRKHSTFIVIAHKLDTVQDADQIIVLSESGTIAEIGTHDQLYSAGGDYRRFWDRRNQASGWTLVS